MNWISASGICSCSQGARSRMRSVSQRYTVSGAFLPLALLVPEFAPPWVFVAQPPRVIGVVSAKAAATFTRERLVMFLPIAILFVPLCKKRRHGSRQRFRSLQLAAILQAL